MPYGDVAMIVVEFFNVGRDKATWRADVSSTASEHLEHALKAKGALWTVNLGFGVDFTDDVCAEGKASGLILVGLGRVVGGWRVVS